MLHSRGDALQLVGINTRTDAATAIGVPRDSWVSIPGHGMNKINAALYYGGPQGIGRRDAQPGRHHARLRDGHPVPVLRGHGRRHRRHRRCTTRAAFSDPYLKKEGFKAGRIHLGGYDAMAFSRIRNELPGGDFDRSANQQRTLRGIHARIRSQADRPASSSAA